jgi:hypothetical protein
MKYNVGDVVQIRPDLKIGMIYYNENSPIGDTFSYSMRNNLGKIGRIVGVSQGKYLLDIDYIHSYTDSMLQYPKDKFDDLHDDSDYEFNPEVEKLIIYMETQHLAKMIDEAIDNGDRALFIKLSEEYREKKNFLTTIS